MIEITLNSSDSHSLVPINSSMSLGYWEVSWNRSLLGHLPDVEVVTVDTSGMNPNATRPARHLTLTGQMLITFVYVFGASANICSLVLLSQRESTRNRKLTLMVRCLAGNDLLALGSSFLLMYMQMYLRPEFVTSRWFCGLRVLTRLFGFSSGSVASVMAVERYIALTRPFVYQKHITYKLIKRAIFTLWFLVLALVFLPLLGFGLYYDPKSKDPRHICTRYRYATETSDVAYAYLVFFFGTLMCVVIVCCNLAVVRVLCRLGPQSMARRTTMTRDSRELAFNHTTPDELSFAKLMVILCVFFVACWLPQMVTIVIAQANPSMKDHPFYRVADVCTALNFILDPVVYVLSRRPHRRGLRRLLKPLCHLCWSHPETSSSGRSNSQDSSGNYKASCVQAIRVRAVSRTQLHHYGHIILKGSDDESDQSSLNPLRESKKGHHLSLQPDLLSRTPTPMMLSDTAENEPMEVDPTRSEQVQSEGSSPQTKVNIHSSTSTKITYHTSL